MIQRIVKLTIQEDKVDNFKEKFVDWQPQIRAQPGCEDLELWQDVDDSRLLFTYSQWQNQSSLDAYRSSELFATVWPQTKAMFDDRPVANSVERVEL